MSSNIVIIISRAFFQAREGRPKSKLLLGRAVLFVGNKRKKKNRTA